MKMLECIGRRVLKLRKTLNYDIPLVAETTSLMHYRKLLESRQLSLVKSHAKVNCIALFLSNLLHNNIERLRERKRDLNTYDRKMKNIQDRFKGVARIIFFTFREKKMLI